MLTLCLQMETDSSSTLGHCIWPSLKLQDFKGLSAAVGVLTSGCVTWYPEFSCALLAVQLPKDQPAIGILGVMEELSLHVVALDSWTCSIHRCENCTSGITACRAYAGSVKYVESQYAL